MATQVIAPSAMTVLDEETIAELREAGVTDSEIRNAFASAISRQVPVK